MRRSILDSRSAEEEEGINLTPMLDVVFIMLIFFIVTASFVKEAGVEINRRGQWQQTDDGRRRCAKAR